MAEIVTIELPETLAQRAREIAVLTNRQIEDVLVEWIDRASIELPVESLPDDWVLALCDLQMESEQQEALSNLLAGNREGQLNDEQASQLDELMQVYRQGLVRKARALKVAVERGAIAPRYHRDLTIKIEIIIEDISSQSRSEKKWLAVSRNS